MGVVNKAEDQLFGLATVLLLVALAAVAAIAYMGLPKFWAWLSGFFKRVFGAVPAWLDPVKLSEWLGRLWAGMDINAPLGHVFRDWSAALGSLGGGDGSTVAQVATGTSGTGPDSVSSYGGGE
jgi:hypothetical protein